MRIKAVLLSLLFVNAVASQDSSFTAKEAIDLALKQNLDIQIASTDLDIAKANNNWGNAGGLPTATGNIFNTEAISNINQKLANGSNIERNNVSNSSINANLAISWRVFNGMRVRSTMERFDAMEKMGTIAVAQRSGRLQLPASGSSWHAHVFVSSRRIDFCARKRADSTESTYSTA